jgi:hypothetical protein
MQFALIARGSVSFDVAAESCFFVLIEEKNRKCFSPPGLQADQTPDYK